MMFRHVNSQDKIALFMSADKVKFRRPVKPGDQLEIDVKITQTKGGKIASSDVVCKVNDKIVSSATLMFTIVMGNEA